MLVCPEDLENGVSKLPPNHTTLLRMSPGSVYFVFYSIFHFNPTRYKNLEKLYHGNQGVLLYIFFIKK